MLYKKLVNDNLAFNCALARISPEVLTGLKLVLLLSLLMLNVEHMKAVSTMTVDMRGTGTLLYSTVALLIVTGSRLHAMRVTQSKKRESKRKVRAPGAVRRFN